MKKFNVVVIGLGRIGMTYGLDKKRTQPASHISAVFNNNNLQLSAICDQDENSRNLFIEKYGDAVNIYDDYTNLIWDINDKKISFDIIVIATPDSTHSKILEYIIKNLKTPKKRTIIFCEKPIALDSVKARKIKNLLKKSKLNIVVNHSRRWSNIWQEAFRLSKKIGTIQKASLYFSTSPENKEVSQIRDGIHIGDLIGWFKTGGKTSVNRITLPYFIYDYYLWGTKGKIEVLNWGQILNFYKVQRSSRFEGFNELKLHKSKKQDESYLVNTYKEFVEFLHGKRNSLTTNAADAFEALKNFERYVYDKNLSRDSKT